MVESVTLEEDTLYGWNVFRLRAGPLCCSIAPAIGGRMVSLTFEGRELLFVQRERQGETFDFGNVTDLRAEKRRIGFGLWGGDKTWVAPQSDWWEGIPPLELDAAAYDVRTGDGYVGLRSPMCRETGLCIVRGVKLEANGGVTLSQSLINESEKPIRRGLWNVTQCLRPFDVYLPLLREEVLSYPGEGRSEELRDELLQTCGDWVRIPCATPQQFKYGGRARQGVVVALREEAEETLVFSRKFYTDPQENFAHNASVEIYNSPDHNYLEIEVHAPLKTLAPGETFEHRQLWKISRVKTSDDRIGMLNSALHV